MLTSYQEITHLFHQDGIEGRIFSAGRAWHGQKPIRLLLWVNFLLQRAKQANAPIPVLIDLSGWQGETMRSWLIDYLWEEYRVAKNHCRRLD